MQSQTQQALYRLWRPQTFDAVCAQTAIKLTLREAVKQGNISHAYLFCGTRGTGKTSLAKIFSRAINCQNPDNGNPCNSCDICKAILDNKIMDVLELDAASNNSVDNIRHIIDEVPFLPALAKFKVYIIDEVHMLSSSAFNALLKTLEEPPAHVVFILATTEPQKIPATILSRCQRYDLQRIADDDMAAHLQKIADALHIRVETPAMKMLIKLADGGMRDAISLLDQCKLTALNHNGVLSLRLLEELLGKSDSALLLQFMTAILHRDTLSLIRLIDALALKGLDYARFLQDLAFMYRQALLLKLAPQAETRNYTGLDDSSLQTIDTLLPTLTPEYCLAQIRNLSDLLLNLKSSMQARITLEVGLLGCLNVVAPLTQKAGATGLSSKQYKTEVDANKPGGNGTPVHNAVNVAFTTQETTNVTENSVSTETRTGVGTNPTEEPTAATETAVSTATGAALSAAPETLTTPGATFDEAVAEKQQQFTQEADVTPFAEERIAATCQDNAEELEAETTGKKSTEPPVTASTAADTDNVGKNETATATADSGADMSAALPETVTASATLTPQTPSQKQAETTEDGNIEIDLLTLSEQLVNRLQANKQTSLSLLLNYRPLEQEANVIILPLNPKETHLYDIINTKDSIAALNVALKQIQPHLNLEFKAELVDDYGNRITARNEKNEAEGDLPPWLEKLQAYAEQEQLSFTYSEKTPEEPGAWD